MIQIVTPIFSRVIGYKLSNLNLELKSRHPPKCRHYILCIWIGVISVAVLWNITFSVFWFDDTKNLNKHLSSFICSVWNLYSPDCWTSFLIYFKKNFFVTPNLCLLYKFILLQYFKLLVRFHWIQCMFLATVKVMI